MTIYLDEGILRLARGLRCRKLGAEKVGGLHFWLVEYLSNFVSIFRQDEENAACQLHCLILLFGKADSFGGCNNTQPSVRV